MKTGNITTIAISSMGEEYDVNIGSGLLARVHEFIPGLAGTRCALITDDIVGELYADIVAESLKKINVESAVVVVPHGEKSKSIEMLQVLYSALHSNGITRDCFAVALGGGMIGDLAGFVAATYLRGIPLVQIPTSLLAQADSSIGGKVAIDLAEGKNLAGVFCQPKAVIIDTSTLMTLPKREFFSGMAEVIKYGAIADGDFFEYLESGGEDAERIVARCCEIKARYVEADPLDKGIRAQLNFGHTLGHALEYNLGLGNISHGEAVSIGMVAAARWGELLGVTEAGTELRLKALLTQNSLPISVKFDLTKVLDAMLHDKKAGQNGIDLILIESIGKASTYRANEKELEYLLREIEWN